VVDELKALFISLVIIMKYEWLDEFLSTKLEENTCLESYLAEMHGTHGCLVHVLDYRMTYRFEIDGMMCLLPPLQRSCLGICMR
jgi:hypothetical protein